MLQNLKAIQTALEAGGMTLLFSGEKPTGIMLHDANQQVESRTALDGLQDNEDR